MKNKKIAITAGAVLCAVSSLFIVVVAAAGVIGAAMQSRAFTTISKDALEFGDLLFFDWDNDGLRMEHVGIYIGSGQMLHAANPNDGVLIIALTSYYYNHMPCAGRPIGGGHEVIPAFDAYGSPISRITAEDTDALSRYLFSLDETDPQKKLEQVLVL